MNCAACGHQVSIAIHGAFAGTVVNDDGSPHQLECSRNNYRRTLQSFEACDTCQKQTEHRLTYNRIQQILRCLSCGAWSFNQLQFRGQNRRSRNLRPQPRLALEPATPPTQQENTTE